MLVEEIMTTDVVTVPADRSIRDAVAAMRERGTAFCIVEDDGIPSGLVTEHGIVNASLETHRPLAEIPFRHFVTGFETVVTPKKTVYYAVGTMLSRDVENLAVKEGFDIVGVLTQADVMENLTNLTKETAKNLKGHTGWKP